MFNPYQNFVDSYYMFSLLCNQPYFNYDPYFNPAKLPSNLTLQQSQGRNDEFEWSGQIAPAIEINQSSKPKCQHTPKPKMVKKQKVQYKIEKQISYKKKKRIAKPSKKADLVQKQGRNSHSNILRKFFKLLSMKNEFKQTIEKIIKKYRFSIEVDEFLNKINEKNIDHRNYIRVKQVQWLFQDNEQVVYKIGRILFQNYVENYYIEHLLSSKKTDSKSINFHLRGRRTLGDQVREKNSEQYSNEMEERECP